MTKDEILFQWLGLFADILVPLVLAFIALATKRYVDGLERKRFSFELGIKWRQETFQELSKNLNMLQRFYCYFGDWQELNLDDVRQAKRRTDELVFGNKFLWSKEFIENWQEFNNSVYAENQGIGSEFKFRANKEMHKHNYNWSEGWEDSFVDPEARIKRQKFMEMSNALLASAAKEIGINPY